LLFAVLDNLHIVNTCSADFRDKDKTVVCLKAAKERA